MRLFITLILLCLTTTAALGVCESQMETFSKHQLVIKGMMDMNFKGELNSETADAIGERMSLGQEAQNAGDFKKACNIYDSIIKDYGFSGSLTGRNKTEDSGGSSPEQEKKSDSAAESQAEAKPASE